MNNHKPFDPMTNEDTENTFKNRPIGSASHDVVAPRRIRRVPTGKIVGISSALVVAVFLVGGGATLIKNKSAELSDKIALGMMDKQAMSNDQVLANMKKQSQTPDPKDKITDVQLSKIKNLTPKKIESITSIPPSKADFSSPKALAISLSYPLYKAPGKELGQFYDPNAFTSGGPIDRKLVHPSYQQARNRAVDVTRGYAAPITPRSDRFWADCAAFTGTVVNNLIDHSYPGNLVSAQRTYLTEKGSGWKIIGTSSNYRPQDYKAGDIFITAAGYQGHTFMWVGDYKGVKNVVAEASYGTEGSSTAHMPGLHINKVTKAKDGRGRAYEVWRYVGKPKVAGVNGTIDYNNDGHADFLTVRKTDSLHLYPGNGKGSFLKHTTIAEKGWSDMDVVTMSDVNGDGRSDMAAINTKTGILNFYPGDGKGNFVPRLEKNSKGVYVSTPVSLGSGFSTIRNLTSPGDINGDGISDLVGIRDSNGELITWTFNKSVKIAKKTELRTGWKNWTIASGSDMNSDGKADLLARSPSGDLYLYPGDGKGDFPHAKRIKIGTGWSKFDFRSTGDFNGDGKADIIARDTKNGDLYLYKGTGKGGFSKPRVKIGKGFNTMPQIK